MAHRVCIIPFTLILLVAVCQPLLKIFNNNNNNLHMNRQWVSCILAYNKIMQTDPMVDTICDHSSDIKIIMGL